MPANAAYPPAELAGLVAAARPDVAVLDDPSRLDPATRLPGDHAVAVVAAAPSVPGPRSTGSGSTTPR